jgi:hypothetical protein
MKLVLATLDPEGLPTLRVAAAFFLVLNLLAGVYIYRNRRRFFYRDVRVDGDVDAVRWLRLVGVTVPWFVLTSRLTITIFQLWAA